MGADTIGAKLLGVTSQNAPASGFFVPIFVVFIAIPIVALINTFLSIVAQKNLNSENYIIKLLGLVLFGIVISIIAVPTFLTLSEFQQDRSKRKADIESLSFTVYMASSDNPLKGSSNFPVSKDVELRCRGLKHNYTGSNNLIIFLLEMNADEYGCPEFQYINREKYDKALKAAEENTTFDKSFTVVSKEIDGDTVLLVSDKGDLRYIYGIKNNTLISIVIGVPGGCFSGSECENDIFEFYRSLEPISND